MRIGIIGAGFTGMVLARRLAALGHSVTVLEKAGQIGGLATHHDYGPFVWDRFYHCVLPSDRHLISVLEEIGLRERLGWTRTLTGFYVDGRLHSLSSGLDYLRFPPLGLVGKLRLAWTILASARIDDWRALEEIPVEEWLIRRCGKRTFEKMWKPLLLAKLGESYRRVSAVFIWSYLKRLFSARDASAQKEHLGYISGGYRAVFTRLEEAIRRSGGEIRLGTTVRRLRPSDGAGLEIEIDGEGGPSPPEHFDRVIFTGPAGQLEQVAGNLARISRPEAPVEYLGVVCLVLVTRRPLVPYYIVNIADPEIPFTGIIGMSGLVPPDEFAGRHLTYLPKYVPSNDPILGRRDEEIRTAFLEGLKRMLPDFRPEDVESTHVNRAAIVQPLQVVGYSKLVPDTATAHEDFFILNTSQLVGGTLNNNEVARAVGEFMAAHGSRFAPARNERGPATREGTLASSVGPLPAAGALGVRADAGGNGS